MLVNAEPRVPARGRERLLEGAGMTPSVTAAPGGLGLDACIHIAALGVIEASHSRERQARPTIEATAPPRSCVRPTA